VERPAVKPLPAPTRVEAAAKVPQRATKVVKVKRAEVKRVEVKRVEVKKKRPGAKAKHFVFAWPVKKARVTSRFGMRRHPKLKRRKMHKGTDFGGPKGKRVHATGPGKVLRAGRGGGGVGIHVVIEHPGGWTSRYFHLSKVDVKAGATVRRGQLIGRVGSTGRSTGPHLHFQVEYKGKAINPERLIGRRSDKVRRPRR
jgi:murein DD-endopeptidase MepM/ murein hydrolase activator NlpD